MDDFERRLASRLSAYEQSVSVPDAPAVAPAPRRPAWAAVAVVVVLAVGIGLVGPRLLTAVRPAGEGVTSLSWATYPFVAGADVADLIAVGDRLIATGSIRGGASEDRAPAAWYSDDRGVTWRHATVEGPAQATPVVSHELASVAQRGDVLLALDAYTVATVSETGAGGADGATVTTTVWISTDGGATWTIARPVPAAGAHIVAGPAGFIVFGTVEGGAFAGWRTTDASSWQALALHGIDADVAIADVAYNGSQFMAVGVHIVDDRTGASGAWVSTDGSSWTAIDYAGGIAGTGSGVSPVGDGFAVGGSRPESEDPIDITPVVWTSSGAGEWKAQVVRVSLPVAAATDVVSNDFGELVHVVSGARVPASVKSDELWFLPASSAGANKQNVPLPVGAIAAMADRFVVISRCGVQPPGCTRTVSVGTPVTTAVPSPDSSQVTSPSPTSMPLATMQPTGSPSPTSRAASAAWVATSIGEAGGIQAMVQSGPTLTAFGWAQDDLGMPGGETAWTSGDGSTWSQAGQITVDGQPANGVVFGSAVWMSSGYVVGGYGGVDQTLPIILTSDDRTHWASAELPQDLTCGRIDRLTQHGPQLIAVGFDCIAHRALLLTSPGGDVWVREDTGFADLEGAELSGAIDVDGALVAVGSSTGPDGLPAASVWRSSGGKGEAIAALGQGHARDIAAGRDRFVIIGDLGADVSGAPAIWTSIDGVTWTLARRSDQADGTLVSVIPTDDGFLAVGSEQRSDGTQAPMLYSSRDGLRWERAPITGIDRGYLTSIISTRFGPIAFGTSEDETGMPAPIVVTPNR